tara:strand:+ start:303 stop:461 length:159 start_codon:yes stop_codon:yes gene_type:complete
MIKFIKKILNGFVESWAGFKKDEHIEWFEDIPKPEIPVHKLEKIKKKHKEKE